PFAAFWRQENRPVTLWEIDIHPAPGQPDLIAQHVLATAADIGLANGWNLAAARGFLIQGDIAPAQAETLARELLADSVVERYVLGRPGDAALSTGPGQLVHVMPKPGVTDPVAASTLSVIGDFGIPANAVVTLTKYWVEGLTDDQLQLLARKLLANDSIEQVVIDNSKLSNINLS